ncbi:MAG: GAF domain-containing protein [Deltaproteobacteria bacterium]|nr:GAF domain-containing protein [Deltaproteobacteria bacterium]
MDKILDEPGIIGESLERILGHILNLFKRVGRAAIILLDNDLEEILNLVIRSQKCEDNTAIPFSRHLVEQVLQLNKPVLISDTQNEKEIDFADTLKLDRVRSLMCMPLIVGSLFKGLIYIDSFREPNGFRSTDISLLVSLRNRIAFGIENTFLNGQGKSI